MLKNRIPALLLCLSILFSSIGVMGVSAVNISPVTLKYYDDRMDVSGMSVEITDAGAPSSHKVGYNVADGTKDSAVLTLSGNTLIATGVGTARVRLDGIEYTVNISAAPLSLFLLMGQSNMEGSDGNAAQSIANTDGQIYSTYGDRTLLLASNADTFVPSALAGEGSLINTKGTTANISNYPVNMLCAAGNGKQGVDSGIGYEWNLRTGKKAWIVNVASGGSIQASWVPGGENYLRAISTMTAVYSTLSAEIAAGHYTLDRMGYFWCQGESDAACTAEAFTKNYLQMHNSLKADLAFDHDSDPSTADRTLEFGNILMIRAATNVGGAGYRQGTLTATDAKIEQSFLDLQMTGPRAAQYLMAADKDLPDINVVSNITEKWVTMPDGTDGVADYFKAKYDGGKVDYPVQTAQAAYWYSPKLPADVHPTVHYAQIGYNEIGRDAAKNTCFLLSEDEPDSLSASVRMVAWDGFSDFDFSHINTTVGSHSLAIPVAEPVYCSKNIELHIPDSITYNFGDVTGSGMITVSCTPLENAPDKYRWEFKNGQLCSADETEYTENSLTRLSGTTAEDGTFSSTQYKLMRNVVLLHNREWSVEWRAQAGEYMLFSSDLKASTAGARYIQISKSNNGISMGERSKVYDGYGVDLSRFSVSIADSHTYKLVNAVNEDGSNTISLYVDGILTDEMSAYCKGGVFDGTYDDRLNGQDFLFNYIGAAPYTLRSCKIEYIEVNEGIAEEDDTEDETTVLKGDIDGDGEVTMLDLFRLKLFTKQKAIPTDAEIAAGDIDGDGELTMVDSFEIKYRVAKGAWR